MNISRFIYDPYMVYIKMSYMSFFRLNRFGYIERKEKKISSHLGEGPIVSIVGAQKPGYLDELGKYFARTSIWRRCSVRSNCVHFGRARRESKLVPAGLSSKRIHFLKRS